MARLDDVPELTSHVLDLPGFIVGARMKAVIESFRIPKSEFFPIGMVLRDKDVTEENTNRLGGGAVVEGRFWLWHVYNRYDLIDWERTEADQYRVVETREDLPGAPVEELVIPNPWPWGKGKLGLTSLPYDESPVFELLGSGKMIASPAFASALHAAGLLSSGGRERYATALLRQMSLDPARSSACLQARRQACFAGRAAKLPPSRVVGTDTVFEDEFGRVA